MNTTTPQALVVDYDEQGRPVRVVGRTGCVTTCEWRETARARPAPARQDRPHFEYDATGALTKAVDLRGRVTTFTWYLVTTGPVGAPRPASRRSRRKGS
jgi:hypothetical protein